MNRSQKNCLSYIADWPARDGHYTWQWRRTCGNYGWKRTDQGICNRGGWYNRSRRFILGWIPEPVFIPEQSNWWDGLEWFACLCTAGKCSSMSVCAKERWNSCDSKETRSNGVFKSTYQKINWISVHRRTGQVNTDRKRKKKLTHEKKISCAASFLLVISIQNTYGSVLRNRSWKKI